MSTSISMIDSISDTARWVACYRAQESARSDAHFKDPWAGRLAGAQGERILQDLPGGAASSWTMVVRTCVFDEIILRTIRNEKIDTVLNLASGLDTRPYRMELDPTLKWIEVDLPALQSYKEEMLAGAAPRCQLERVNVDLSNATLRQELFDRVGKSSRRVLVLTEGLMLYLTAEQADALAHDLKSQSSFVFWLQDYMSPLLLRFLQKRWGRRFGKGDSSMHFGPPEGAEYFTKFGWTPIDVRSTLIEAKRLHRPSRLPRIMSAILGLLSFVSKARLKRFLYSNGQVLLKAETSH